jgi:hypothetical protein
MPPQRIYRAREVRAFYGNPSLATFAYWRRVGRVPQPDVQLGEQIPGWTEGLIERHQQELIERGVATVARQEDARRRAKMPRKKKAAASLAPAVEVRHEK